MARRGALQWHCGRRAGPPFAAPGRVDAALELRGPARSVVHVAQNILRGDMARFHRLNGLARCICELGKGSHGRAAAAAASPGPGQTAPWRRKILRHTRRRARCVGVAHRQGAAPPHPKGCVGHRAGPTHGTTASRAACAGPEGGGAARRLRGHAAPHYGRRARVRRDIDRRAHRRGASGGEYHAGGEAPSPRHRYPRLPSLLMATASALLLQTESSMRINA